jgi:hypothetical protein
MQSQLASCLLRLHRNVLFKKTSFDVLRITIERYAHKRLFLRIFSNDKDSFFFSFLI